MIMLICCASNQERVSIFRVTFSSKGSLCTACVGSVTRHATCPSSDTLSNQSQKCPMFLLYDLFSYLFLFFFDPHLFSLFPFLVPSFPLSLLTSSLSPRLHFNAFSDGFQIIGKFFSCVFRLPLCFVLYVECTLHTSPAK